MGDLQNQLRNAKPTPGPGAWTCSARPAKVRRKRSKTRSPKGPPLGGRRRRPLWVLECAFASPWPAARCRSVGPVSELVLRNSAIFYTQKNI